MVEGFNPELASQQKEILVQLYGTLDSLRSDEFH